MNSALGLMIKETGTPITFSQAKALDTQNFVFQNMTFGLYAYQGSPVTVDSATRNSFANGNLADITNQLVGQGMQPQYIRISWNETSSGNNYYITDLVVGLVIKVTGIVNTGPAYAIDALKKVGWFNQMVSKLTMPWQAWELIPEPATRPLNRFDWDAVANPVEASSTPSADDVRTHFIVDGQVDVALGKFVKKMVDNGYATTIKSYQVYVGFEQETKRNRQNHMVTYYRAHTRLSVDFTTTPSLGDSRTLFAWIIVAIGVAVAAIITAVAVYNWLNNLSTQRTDTYGWVQNPDTGEWEWVVTGSQTSPPSWWSDVFIIVGVAIVGVAGLLLLPRLLPKKKQEERPK
jgi:ribosomal protein S21